MSTVPSGNNVYVAGFSKNQQASELMGVDFSRNVSSYAINNWTKIVPVSLSKGFYAVFGVAAAGRVLDTAFAGDVWADGDDANDNRGMTEEFEYLPYVTQRYQNGFRVGSKAQEQAPWDVVALNARRHAQLAMTRRAQLAITLATTAGNYTTAFKSNVADISGNSGTWDASTSSRLDIQRSINYAYDLIRKYTLGAVKKDDFRLVMGPDVAREISMSQEVVDLIKQSPGIQQYVKEGFGPNTNYNLPAKLYGVEVVVEDTVKVTSAKGATDVFADAWPAGTAILCSRPGGLTSDGQTAEVATLGSFTNFVYEDMTVEDKFDSDNRVHRGRIVDDFVFKKTADKTAFLFQNCLS